MNSTRSGGSKGRSRSGKAPTVTEWMEALANPPKKKARQPKGITSQELADRLDCSQTCAQKKIRKGVLDGYISFNGFRDTVTVTDRPCSVPVYILSRKRNESI